MINVEPFLRFSMVVLVPPPFLWYLQFLLAGLHIRVFLWHLKISVKCKYTYSKNLQFQILTARDYALILGMPGTGKTSTMVHAVNALLIRGASILLTSYTNSAVDNLLIKLKSQVSCFFHVLYMQCNLTRELIFSLSCYISSQWLAYTEQMYLDT